MRRVIAIAVLSAAGLAWCGVTIAQESGTEAEKTAKEPAAPKETDAPQRDSSKGESPLPADLTTQLGELIARDWKDRPEWARMAVTILKDNDLGMGGRGGWFGPGVSRYGWRWLQERFDKEPANERIERSEMAGVISDAEFTRLDRDGDSTISKVDLDWSGGNPILADWSPANEVFFQLDKDSNGRVTMPELQSFFEKTAGGFEFITPQDLQSALRFSSPSSGNQSRQPPSEVRWMMMRRLLNGELGDLTPGPALNEAAPDFNLPLLAHNDDKTELVLTDRFVKLSDARGKRPVVLIFGSFT